MFSWLIILPLSLESEGNHSGSGDCLRRMCQMGNVFFPPRFLQPASSSRLAAESKRASLPPFQIPDPPRRPRLHQVQCSAVQCSAAQHRRLDSLSWLLHWSPALPPATNHLFFVLVWHPEQLKAESGVIRCAVDFCQLSLCWRFHYLASHMCVCSVFLRGKITTKSSQQLEL